MPNLINADGLQVSTYDEWLAYFTTQLQTIYGADINLESDSPDGQWVNIMIMSILDLQDLLVQIYNMFNPDEAIGVVLDQRVAINGIQRQAGTYTVTPITIVTNQSVNLYGLDQETQPVYTVSDNAGNLWFLEVTELGVSPGTNVFSFRAATPGANLTTPNTINVPVTIVLGVVSVNNPTSYSSLGTNEETDAQLRLRRQKSVSLSSQGYLAGLLAALENISGVSSAFVYENLTSVTDSDGIPGHSIWVIVAGTGTDADIAQAIYTKRNAGCGMYGNTTYTIVQVDGNPFTVKWDTTLSEFVFIAFTATSINGTTAPNIEAIREGLPLSFIPGVNDDVNINTLSTLVQQIDPNTLVTAAGFSLAMTQVVTLSGVAASGTFKVLYDGNLTTTLNWNDSIGTIQTAVQLLPGLSAALVTGSIASQTLTFDLTAVSSVLGLITISASTLATSAPVTITFSYNEGYQNILSPSSKRYQMVVTSPNIIILPMILSPTTSSISVNNSQTYTGLGGYGTYVYSILINNSGGSIDASTGLYTAGAIGSVVDTIKVVDAMGNSATATVSVV